MVGKRNLGILATVMCMAMAVTGCGSTFPDLTEEQYNQTVEYAAGILMRYSNNDQERLVYVDAKDLEKQRQKEAKEEASKAKTEESSKPKKQPAQTPSTPATPENTMPGDGSQMEENTLDGGDLAENMAQTTDEGDANPDEGEATVSDATAGGITLSSEETQEITDDIFLSYQGYMISRTYPESSKSYVVNADKGKKLLVLRFDLYNASGSAKEVNLLPLNLLFEILLNGQNLGYSSVTFLPNDLSSYKGTIDSKAHESVVVLTQINDKDAGSIQDLGMIVTLNGEKQTVNLK